MRFQQGGEGMGSIRSSLWTLKSFYLLSFFGVGSLLPLLSVYLSEVEGLNGYQIGIIMSMTPIVTIFFQPVWGIVSDVTKAPTLVLFWTSLLAGLAGLTFLWTHDYMLLVLIAFFVALFQSAIVPISDSISIQFAHRTNVKYGSIRLYGSLGFGLAVFFMGRLAETTIGLSVIFYAFFISLAISAVIARFAPKETSAKRGKITAGMKELLNQKKFSLFLLITFLLFGPNLANNFYFGLFVEDRGGTFTGIGIAFLIAVLSEIPFMKVSGSWIMRWGLLPIVLVSGFISMIRWFLYFTEPSLTVIYLSAVLQGFSLGLFIPAGLQYIREITPAHIATTGVTLYSAIGNGCGNWFSTFLAGIIFEQFHIYMVYFFFGILTLVSVLLTVYLIRLERQSQKRISKVALVSKK
jgi:MFS transporter, PPP family, 3-phenylpropionic acid transporter